MVSVTAPCTNQTSLSGGTKTSNCPRRQGRRKEASGKYFIYIRTQRKRSLLKVIKGAVILPFY
jgi:hypothetical protein